MNKSQNINGTTLSIGPSDSQEDRYVILFSAGAKDFTFVTYDAEIYNNFDSDGDAGDAAREKALSCIRTAIEFYVCFGVATFNADPFCIEGDSLNEVVDCILENGLELDLDEDDKDKLGINPESHDSWLAFKSGPMLLGVWED